jgi:hypothetical protein
MHLKTSRHFFDPVSRAAGDVRHYISERPKRSLGSLVFMGLLVWFGIWIWPEVKRTIRIHRM